jgi:hypothetical protein
VFQGYRPERFDVEVIDVLPNFRPKQDLILIRTRHPRLEVTKDRRRDEREPDLPRRQDGWRLRLRVDLRDRAGRGCHPDRNMLDDLARPLPDTIDGWPLRPLPARTSRARAVQPKTGDGGRSELATSRQERLAAASGRHRFRGPLAEYDVRAHVAEVAAATAYTPPAGTPALTPVATPLAVGGLTPGALALATELLAPLGLEPLQAGGGGGTPDPAAPDRYVDGGAIGVDLIGGDISMSGLGTVTRVEGDQLIAFGHPMMEAGATAVPTSVGRVVWMMASEMRSFKVGNPARPLGAMVNDRQASIVVSHATRAPTIR